MQLIRLPRVISSIASMFGLLHEWSIDRLIVAATLGVMPDIGAQVLLHWTDTTEPKARHRRRGGSALAVIVEGHS